MKKFVRIIGVALLVAALTLPTALASANSDSLQELYKEEITARVTYEKAMEQFGNEKPFSNIVKSEERHQSAVERLAEKKEVLLEDPEIEVEDFENYEKAIERAIEIEKGDIEVIERLLKDNNLDEDTERVYENLLHGSQNHLQAFEKALAGDVMECGSRGMTNKKNGNTMGQRMRNKVTNVRGQGKGLQMKNCKSPQK